MGGISAFFYGFVAGITASQMRRKRRKRVLQGALLLHLLTRSFLTISCYIYVVNIYTQSAINNNIYWANINNCSYKKKKK